MVNARNRFVFVAPAGHVTGQILCGVYEIINTDNSKRYYGQTANIYKRYKGHLSTLDRGIHGNPRLQNAWNAYPTHIFEMRVVCLLDIKDLIAAEQQCLIDNVGIGYNIAVDATATRRGIPQSPETIAKMRIASTGRIVSKETRARLSAIHTGRACAESTKQKIGAANRGAGNFYFGKRGAQHPRFGVKWSRKTRQRMAIVNDLVRCRPVIQYDKHTGKRLKLFPSISAAARATGADIANIGVCCRDVDKSAYGYRWKYADRKRK